MGKSSQLRLGEIRRVFQLVHEVQDLNRNDRDPRAWRRHLAEGLSRMLGTGQCVSMLWRNYTAVGNIQLEEWTESGTQFAAATSFWNEQHRKFGFRADVVTDRISRISSRVAVRLRREIVSDDEWNKSEIVRGLVEISGLSDMLIAFFRLPTAGRVNGVALNRLRGDRTRFTERDRSMLRLLNLEMYRLYREGRLRIGSAGESLDAGILEHLPPRTQQILGFLLQGLSLKQIAMTLGLSRHTVNDHVKVIHRRMGVSSRAELLARCLGEGDGVVALGGGSDGGNGKGGGIAG